MYMYFLLNILQDPEFADELDASDDELAKDLDMHSLIISSLQEEPMFTAEEVLEEIEKIMQVKKKKFILVLFLSSLLLKNIR